MDSAYPNNPPAIAATARTVQNPLWRIMDRGQQWTGNHLNLIKELTCGCMSGSAVFLPLLYPPFEGSRGIYHLAIGIFICSSVSFSWLHRSEISANAFYTLPVATLIFIAAIFSPRTFSKDFAPYMALSSTLAILVTIYVVPKILIFLRQPGGFILREVLLARQDLRVPRSDGASIGSNSSRTEEDFQDNIGRYVASESDPFPASVLREAFLYMDREPPLLSRAPSELELERGSSTHTSVSGDSMEPLIKP